MMQGYFMYLSIGLLYLESKQPQLKLKKKALDNTLVPVISQMKSLQGVVLTLKEAYLSLT